jgi:hypothetical protein
VFSFAPAQPDGVMHELDERRDQIGEKDREHEQQDDAFEFVERPHDGRHAQHDQDQAQHRARLRPRGFRHGHGCRLRRFRHLLFVCAL